jgi:hypothetical protein
MHQSIKSIEVIWIQLMYWRDIAIIKELKYTWNDVEIVFQAINTNQEDKKYKFTFKTIQYINILTIDSWLFLWTNSNFCEIINSNLIDWLRKWDSNFFNIYNKSKHFHLMFYDEIIDIICYDYDLKIEQDESK